MTVPGDETGFELVTTLLPLLSKVLYAYARYHTRIGFSIILQVEHRR